MIYGAPATVVYTPLVAGAPTTGTWATSSLVVDSNDALWVCTSGGTPGTWVEVSGGGSSSADIFTPEAYGGIADGKLFEDGAITGGLSAFTAPSSTPFVPGDVGKTIIVWAAGASSTTWLFTTISAYVSAGAVTLAATAGTTASATGFVYGTDNTAAIQAAINAANTRCQLGDGATATVKFGDGIYCVSSPATLGTTTGGGNAQITLPIVTASTGVKSQLTLAGTGPAELPHFFQINPSQAGSIILGMRVDGSLNTTFGPTSVIGGPVDGYGGGGGTFSNMHLRVNGLSIIVPRSATCYAGLEIGGLGQASIDDFSYLPLGVVPASTVWPVLSIATVPSYTYGLRMPLGGNNAVSDIGSYTCYQAQIGLICNEHTTIFSLKTLYAVYGMLPGTSSAGTMQHGITVQNWCCEEVTNVIGSVGSGFFKQTGPIGVTVARASLESYTHIVNDAASLLFGDIGFDIINSATTLLTTQYAAGGTTIKLRQIAATQGVAAAPPAVPLTTVAQLNGYYRDATINVQPGTATISSITVDSTVLTGITAGPVRVPSGHTITLAYTGGTPVWQWFLD